MPEIERETDTLRERELDSGTDIYSQRDRETEKER